MRRARSTKATAKRPPKVRKASRKPRPAASRGRAVEAALAALAHEVRTPLTGILAHAELLLASDLPERERRWADAIKSAAEHLGQLATLVVDGVKADAHHLTLQRAPFRPAALIGSVAATLHARAELKGLQAEIAVGETLPDVAIGDAVRLRAALENLIDNAVKFTDRGRVGFAATAERVARNRVRLVFTVSDEGIGIGREEIKRLFRPFAQASDAIARRFGGTGLGLVFVRRVARAMDGDLSVKSVPGRGTTFRLAVVVERAPAAMAGGPGGDAARERRPHQRARVLCAEDNPYGRVVLNTILTELGHVTDFVATGDAAVAALSRDESKYDLVVMDVTLPGLTGIEATKRIRALPGAVSRIPIIGVSGRNTTGDEKAARTAGMNDYLVKPLSPSALAEAIAAHAFR